MASSDISEKTHRLFIAVKPELNFKILESISLLKTELPKSQISWVAWENLHLTLHFLGEISNYSIKKINTAIASSIKNTEPFSITLRGIGYFGKSIPKVIWIGLDPCEQLKTIHKKLNFELIKHNFNLDKKEFSPHLTIGRIKKIIEIKPFENIIENQQNVEFHKTQVSSVILFESILKPQGPEYKTIEIHRLNQ